MALNYCERIVERTSYLLPDGSVGHYPILFACGREAVTHISTPTHGGLGTNPESWINLCQNCFDVLSGKV